MSNLNARVVTVTPQMAAELLRENTRNRNISDRVVESYARDMAAGRWVLNGEAVKVSVTGRLLDGQQRLTAVVKAGVSVDMVLVSGLPEAAQDTMDQGRRRSFADQLAIHGESNTTVLGSIARRVFQWDQGNTRFSTGATPTAAELAAVLDKHPSLRRSAEVGARTAQAFRATSGTVVGTSHHLLGRVDPEGKFLPEFFALFESGAGLPAGHPVLALRNRFVRDRMASKRVPFHLAVALFIRAWNGQVEGRTMDRLVQTADEPMPPITSVADAQS